MENSPAVTRQPQVVFWHHPDVAAQRLGSEAVLVQLRTNQIYELNCTGARLWELLKGGADRATLHEGMQAEFDIDREQLAAEVEAFLSLLVAEQLVTSEGRRPESGD